jgi:hypothetical protein
MTSVINQLKRRTYWSPIKKRYLHSIRYWDDVRKWSKEMQRDRFKPFKKKLVN